MKLKLNKKKLKNLSKDRKVLPTAMTPNIAGGVQQSDMCAGGGSGDVHSGWSCILGC